MRLHHRLVAFAASALAVLLNAPGASAYLVTIDVTSQSRAFASSGPTVFPTPGINLPQAHYSSNLPNPLTGGQDPSIEFLLPSGAFMAATGRYEATVDPGGIHVASRSFAQIDAPALVDAGLSIEVRGSLATSFQDDVRITLAGLPTGTPFLMTVLARVDGIVGLPFAGGPQPFGIGASGTASGNWGLTLAYRSRPAGVPISISNQFTDGSGGLIRVDQDGVVFNEIAKYGMLGLKTLTFYGISGEQASFDMYMHLGTVGSAGLGPGGSGNPATPAVSVEAGVNLAFDHTFAWGGIAGVTLLDGTPVVLSDVSVQSSSGFDYKNAYVSPVPEPASCVLLAAGALSFAWRRRATRFARAQRSGLRRSA